jgi:3-methyladenine DNA glycosylase AlkD
MSNEAPVRDAAPSCRDVKHALAALACEARARSSARFFKTAQGEYAEGDVFIGVSVPEQRRVARSFDELAQPEVEELLSSAVHEHRLTALLILVRQFERARKPEVRLRLYELYLASLRYVNNWDLVDSSAQAIVGGHLQGRDRTVLDVLASSSSVWERRVSIVATQTFIRKGEFADTLRLAERLVGDPHDLIHKATGWMLREVGQKDPAVLRGFLDKHAAVMPRTMLRYAIEHCSEAERATYMSARASVASAPAGTKAKPKRTVK